MRNANTKTLVAGAGAALIGLAALALSACTTTPPPATTSPVPSVSPGQQTQMAALGETVTVERRWQITAINFHAFNPANLTPTAGNQYVAVRMTVKNISNETQTLNKTGTFVMSDTAGHRYQEVNVGNLSISSSESMPTRAQQEGILLFQAPNTATHFVLSFVSAAQPTYAYVQWSLHT